MKVRRGAEDTKNVRWKGKGKNLRDGGKIYEEERKKKSEDEMKKRGREGDRKDSKVEGRKEDVKKGRKEGVKRTEKREDEDDDSYKGR